MRTKSDRTRETDRKWREKNRDKLIAYRRDWRKRHPEKVRLENDAKRKKDARFIYIEAEKKKGCERCGLVDPCLAIFEFHHLERATKKIRLNKSGLWKHSLEEIVIERQKCVCVCSNCHRRIHNEGPCYRERRTA